MTEDEAAVAVADWIQTTLPELAKARSWLTAHKTQLPDVVVDVDEKAIALRDDRFPELDIQQAALRVFDYSAVLMVEQASVDEGDSDSDHLETLQLRDFGARLESSLLNDGTLGDRVFMATPLVTFNYRLPFVQWADGTRGRQMTLTGAVAEPVALDG